MRRLTVLPCPESWDRMRPDGDGRFCERCQLRVTEVAKLDGDGLERLVDAAASERACVRLELDRGRPRTALGIAAGLVVATLAGCGVPDLEAPSVAPDTVGRAIGPEVSGAVISGLVSDTRGDPLAYALVVVQSTALPSSLEVWTNERGIYSVKDLPPGNYTIQVLAGKANVSKIVEMPAKARFRANFRVDPAQDIVMGLIFEPTMIDTTSASSSYSSRLIEYE